MNIKVKTPPTTLECLEELLQRQFIEIFINLFNLGCEEYEVEQDFITENLKIEPNKKLFLQEHREIDKIFICKLQLKFDEEYFICNEEMSKYKKSEDRECLLDIILYKIKDCDQNKIILFTASEITEDCITYKTTIKSKSYSVLVKSFQYEKDIYKLEDFETEIESRLKEILDKINLT